MAAVAPLVVELHPVAGIPPEYCEFLPKADFEKCVPWLLQNRDAAWLQANASNYAELFADQKSEEVEEKLKELSVAAEPKEGEVIKKLPGGKVKKKEKPEVLIERSVRNKRKCITTVKGLELFGVKLADAAKVFGKKFACGASVVKGAVCEAIDIQGDFQEELAELIVSSYQEVQPENVFYVEKTSKTPMATS